MKTASARRERERRERALVRRMAREIESQEQLNSVLLASPNRVIRREVYEMLRQYIVKFTPEYPAHVAEPHARVPLDVVHAR